MKVNGELVRSERQKRAWSQQHLADACGLGLRTVQRIENTGIASYESVQALAACLELPHARLAARAQQRRLGQAIARRGAKAAGMVASFVAGAVFMSIQSVVADEVHMRLSVTDHPKAEDETPFETEINVEDGSAYELRFEDGFHLVILPEIRPDNKILFTVSIYASDDEDAEPILAPRIIVDSGREGVIQVGDLEFAGDRRGVEFKVYPTIQSAPR